MNTRRRVWPALIAVGVMISAIVSTSCSTPADGSSEITSSNSSATPPTGSSLIKLGEMLADISRDVGRVSTIKEGSEGRGICVLEEKHTSIAGQIETALMLLRMHDRHGLRRIALEGLTTDKNFPSTDWFRAMGGPDDSDLRNQITVGLLRQGEISAVELIALSFPDVVVHAADDPAAYAVEMSDKAGIGGIAYLYKIGFKSVRSEHYPRLQQLQQQRKIKEMIDYIISLDPWANERYERMKNTKGVMSIEQLLRDLKDIENRAASVGAEISSDERRTFSEYRNFFDAAEKRTKTLVESALGIDKSEPLIALNIGAAHTEGTKRLLDESKTGYGVLTPLSLEKNLKAGDLSYDAFIRKNRSQSVAWKEKGLGSLIDGRRKPSPVVGKQWTRSESQMRFATALMARGAGGPNFPDDNLRSKLDTLDHVKVQWGTIRKEPNGDLIYMASVLGEKGWVNIWTRCGIPKAMQVFSNRKGPTLEQLLLDSLEEVRKEEGERTEPRQSPAIEIVTPDVMAAYAREPQALSTIRVSI